MMLDFRSGCIFYGVKLRFSIIPEISVCPEEADFLISCVCAGSRKLPVPFIQVVVFINKFASLRRFYEFYKYCGK